jgi:hypothetical protein
VSLVRRTLLVILTAAAAVASVGNPHFASGGAFDVAGPPAWWQPAGAVLALAALVAAALLWRGAAERAFTLLVGELLLFVLLAAASVGRVGDGYFADGWGGNHFSLFAAALAFRVLLLWLAHRTQVGSRAPAT